MQRPPHSSPDPSGAGGQNDPGGIDGRVPAADHRRGPPAARGGSRRCRSIGPAELDRLRKQAPAGTGVGRGPADDWRGGRRPGSSSAAIGCGSSRSASSRRRPSRSRGTRPCGSRPARSSSTSAPGSAAMRSPWPGIVAGGRRGPGSGDVPAAPVERRGLRGRRQRPGGPGTGRVVPDPRGRPRPHRPRSPRPRRSPGAGPRGLRPRTRRVGRAHRPGRPAGRSSSPRPPISRGSSRRARAARSS